ncbi:NADP-dependent malic enzyme [Bacteroidetes/Chlorobi group bacterium Naka2016]|jgi:malate dehydrogenase (oxaloacetate-decarboxylating)(NADP+)|nr:MAG: NADP-dependent malic enzyme [Bacteroidetes/Chlorobi group bacterium Naka2016]
MKIQREEALEYHSSGRKGKIEVIITKPCVTQRDLSLAYTPGVAEPCREIHKDIEKVYEYTAKGNLVAVISNGTAVLGLGNIGPEAGKPVMEGKGVLFKAFADIDVFDLELRTEDPEEVVRVCQILEPTFGGINLEDIKAPECFYIEEKLKETLQIPVFHDDQHGTAIISGAALLNALELAGKKIDEVKVVYNGAGASGIACAKFHISLGVKKENIIMCDTIGVIYKGRTKGMNPYKEYFAVETDKRTLAEALEGADVFVGLSVGGILTKEMVRSMAPNPIIFAMANPDPEITYEDALDARPDVIMATGRSDYPNQVNNVLGFPFIFRGALDVRATTINEEMKKAAAYALAQLAKEEVPEIVKRAYGVKELKFGREYIIPKPFDPRVLTWVAPAVAKAAMDSGVARKPITDFEEYKLQLDIRMGRAQLIMTPIFNKAASNPKRIVFPEGTEPKIIRAAILSVQEGIAKPILLGKKEIIEKVAQENDYDLTGIEIIDPETYPKLDQYIAEYFRLRQRKGVTYESAESDMKFRRNYFGSMMVRMGDADGMISGLTKHYPETIRPALQIVGRDPRYSKVSGLYILSFKNSVYFLSDTTVNLNPSAEDICDITLQAAEFVKNFDIQPKIALLSYSNFGSAEGEIPEKMRKALQLIKEKRPDLIVDGEMQADTAVVPEIIDETYPFSELKGGANVLIFPDLDSGNIAYKLLSRLGGAHPIGPILLGMSKSVHVLQRGASVNEILEMIAIAVVDAQNKEKAQ